MDVNAVGQLIGAYGFPIVMCGALFWYMINEQKELRQVIQNNSTILLRILEHFKEEN